MSKKPIKDYRIWVQVIAVHVDPSDKMEEEAEYVVHDMRGTSGTTLNKAMILMADLAYQADTRIKRSK